MHERRNRPRNEASLDGNGHGVWTAPIARTGRVAASYADHTVTLFTRVHVLSSPACLRASWVAMSSSTTSVSRHGALQPKTAALRAPRVRPGLRWKSPRSIQAVKGWSGTHGFASDVMWRGSSAGSEAQLHLHEPV